MSNLRINTRRNTFINMRVLFSSYIELCKPGIAFLSVFSAFVGIILTTDKYYVSFTKVCLILLAVLLGSSGSAIINMWYDKDIDKIVIRTRKRPIPSGIINERSAIFTGITFSILSVVLLSTFNIKSSLLMIIAILYYACFYTMILKRNNIHSTEIGGITGCFSPLIGYIAISNRLDFLPIIVSIIIGLWSPPHFWALVIKNMESYKEINIPVLPVLYREKITSIYILLYVVTITCVTFIPFFIGYLGYTYLIAIFIANTIFLYYAIRNYFDTTKFAFKLFHYSITYLLIIFTALSFDFIF